MLNRLKRLWKLSRKDLISLDKLVGVNLETLTDDQIDKLPDAGDGKAEFLGSGTEEEFKQQEKSDKGLKGIFGL